MIGEHDIWYADAGTFVVARLRLISYGKDHSRELAITLVSISRDNGSEYQVRCRRQHLRGESRYWVRVPDRDQVRRELDILRRSMVPLAPRVPRHEAGEITELELADGPGYRASFVWSIAPPDGCEPLARFATSLQRWAGMQDLPGHGGGLDRYLTEEALIARAGRKIFWRGSRYYESGFVTDMRVVGEELHATVRGTEVYPVRIWVEDDELKYSCGCPMGKRGLCCKHVVAVGLVWGAEM